MVRELSFHVFAEVLQQILINLLMNEVSVEIITVMMMLYIGECIQFSCVR